MLRSVGLIIGGIVPLFSDRYSFKNVAVVWVSAETISKSAGAWR